MLVVALLLRLGADSKKAGVMFLHPPSKTQASLPHGAQDAGTATVANTHQVEDTIRVACELGHLRKGWVLPHEDLVL